MRQITSLLAAAVLVIASPMARATLIDNGSYTTDSSTGLDWLDLTATNGMSVTDALTTYGPAGYRYANDVELAQLLESFAITFAFTPANVTFLSVDATTALNFVSLLGSTAGNLGDTALGNFELSGLGRSAYLCISATVCYPSSVTVDLDFSFGVQGIGDFLVRDSTSVPEPGTLSLMFLGVVGVVATRRPKTRTA